MNRPRALLALSLTFALLVALVPMAGATHNNKGTIKVHDDETESPAVRNVPHVSCDFWIEGFQMGDDTGWLVFYGWPPTGDKSVVTPTGDDLTWTAVDGTEPGDYHFLKGPYQLPAGHYRVEAFTDDGHPGSDAGHFAKSKTFWVDPCGDTTVSDLPCPPGLVAAALAEGGITLSWTVVVGATGYNVYRAEGDGSFEAVAFVTTSAYLDSTAANGTAYRYLVTAFDGERESTECETAAATAIPFFPSMAVGALAVLGSLGAFVLLRRKA